MKKWKKQIKKYCKIQSPCPWPIASIGVPHDYFMVDKF
jgi:hypothetical protein